MRPPRTITALIVLATSLVAGFATGADATSAPPIQPGASITMSTTDTVSWCTLDRIYDGTGKRKGECSSTLPRTASP